MEEKYSETSVKRWNKERRAFDKVPQPKCINRYNEHMGGVDLHDLQVSRYHISISSKKWWWPRFAWSLNSALVNSHFFYRDVMGGTIGLLTFSRIVAQSLSHRRRSLLTATVEDQARYDNTSHWPIIIYIYHFILFSVGLYLNSYSTGYLYPKCYLYVQCE